MSFCLVLALIAFALALVPAIVFAGNLREFRRLVARSAPSEHALPAVSVLIPARNEAGSIGAAVNSVLSSSGIEFELLVLDDHSTDETAAIVQAVAQQDRRVRLISSPPLPPGWCGKQHACQILAQQARFDVLVWMDADVRLGSDALERMSIELERSQISLLSGFPFQRTQTWLETLLIPLMHFILLGFLPLAQMRRSLSPAFGAGCGQLFMAKRVDYFAAGGHAAIRASLHDGIALPRAFRKARKKTDVFDASDLAECRMYDSAVGVWRGLLKNAGEGIATPLGIIPWTVLLLGGQVFPAGLLIYFLLRHPRNDLAVLLAALGMVLGIIIRWIAAKRFYARSVGAGKYLSVIGHPVGIVLFLLIQWQSLLRQVLGHRSTWKGRSY